MSLHTNKKNLVKMALNASVDHPSLKGYRGSYDGRARICVGTGGVTYSHAIGDSCMDIVGDHVEPGVSMANFKDGANHAVQTLSCVGNEVILLSGANKGAKGIVTGTHGGVDHTMAWFEPSVIEQMDGTESFLIKGFGQGLKVEETPEVFFMNLDPDLLEMMNLEVDHEGNLVFPVTTIVPSFLMGSGIGSSTLMEGDYDIMTQDKEANEKYGLNQLRLGDFVAIQDHDCEFGPHYKKGAWSIGVVVHSDSYSAGHGPGVSIIATSCQGRIKPQIDQKANLIQYASKLNEQR